MKRPTSRARRAARNAATSHRDTSNIVAPDERTWLQQILRGPLRTLFILHIPKRTSWAPGSMTSQHETFSRLSHQLGRIKGARLLMQIYADSPDPHVGQEFCLAARNGSLTAVNYQDEMGLFSQRRPCGPVLSTSRMDLSVDAILHRSSKRRRLVL